MKHIVSVLLFAVWLSACSDDDVSRQSSSADDSGRPELAGDMRGPPILAVPVGALRAHDRYWDVTSAGGGWMLALTPLDGLTGEDVSHFEVLDVAERVLRNVVAAPDGTLVAIGDEETGVISIRTLDRWDEVARLRAEATITPGNHRLDRLQWSNDSNRLFAWRSYCRAGHCAAEIVDELWEVVPLTGAVRRIGAYQFRRADMVIHPGGDLIYVLADSAHNDPSAHQPFGASVVAIDTATGEIISEVPLPDLAIGFSPGLPPYDDVSAAARYDPAMAYTRPHLFIVHADDTRMTVIDADDMQVLTEVDIGRERSKLDRVQSWIRSRVAREVSANVAQSWERTADVAPGSDLLLISGAERGRFSCPDAGSRSCRRSRPAGLTVVDTTSFDVVFHEDGISSFVHPVSSSWIVGRGEPGLDEAMGGTQDAEFGIELYIIDYHRLALAHVIRFEEPVAWPVATSLDGDRMYVQSRGVQKHVADCSTVCNVMYVIELETAEILSVRILGDGQLVPLQ